MGSKDQGTGPDATQGRWRVIPRTLCFVTHGDDLLLMKRGPHKKIFPGHYNGLGGHIERNEDPLQSAIREIKEESGLNVTNVRYRGTTHINTGDAVGIMLFIFTAAATSKETNTNGEGELEWVHLPALLDDLRTGNQSRQLVEDLPILLPRLFGEQASLVPFFAHVTYDTDDQIQVNISSALKLS